MNFDQELAPALLDQFRRRRAPGDFDSRFRIDFNQHQTKRVEQLLNLRSSRLITFALLKFVKALFRRRADRGAKVIHGFKQPLDLGGQRLPFDPLDERRRRRRCGWAGNKQAGKEDQWA